MSPAPPAWCKWRSRTPSRPAYMCPRPRHGNYRFRRSSTRCSAPCLWPTSESPSRPVPGHRPGPPPCHAPWRCWLWCQRTGPQPGQAAAQSPQPGPLQPEQPERVELPADAFGKTSSLLSKNCVCTNVELLYSPPPPPPPPMLIDRSMPPFGFAVRIGSTPERRVIAVTVFDPADA